MTFKPSEVFLNRIPPLTATMGRTEREVAAALLVRACHVLGDEWQPVTPMMLAKVMQGDLREGAQPWAAINGNPFCRADFRDLAQAGYATLDEATQELALTEKGLAALRRWVRAEAPHE